jgi:hypothetical protein
MTPTATAPTLSPEQAEQMLKLTAGADSVELKLTIPDSSQRATVTSLGIDPLGAQIRQVFFYDTPELALNQSGVVVRTRRVQGRGGDTVVKLRPVVPGDLSPSLRKSPSLGVEVDAMPGGFVCSASFKGKAENDAILKVARGKGGLRKLFTKEQRAFYKTHAPEGLALDDLSRLGPIFVLKLNFVPEGFGRKLVAELWLYPDGSRIFELSTKCPPNEAFQVAAEAKAFLSAHGIDLLGDQQTKTRAALDFYASELQAQI